MNREYPQGNTEFLMQIKQRPFNTTRAAELLPEIGDVNTPILDDAGYSTTYLHEAESENNLEAVRLLLEQGADPNYCNDNLTRFCALFDLQFCADDERDNPVRYEIAKLFFNMALIQTC